MELEVIRPLRGLKRYVRRMGMGCTTNGRQPALLVGLLKGVT